MRISVLKRGVAVVGVVSLRIAAALRASFLDVLRAGMAIIRSRFKDEG